MEKFKILQNIPWLLYLINPRLQNALETLVNETNISFSVIMCKKQKCLNLIRNILWLNIIFKLTLTENIVEEATMCVKLGS